MTTGTSVAVSAGTGINYVTNKWLTQPHNIISQHNLLMKTPSDNILTSGSKTNIFLNYGYQTYNFLSKPESSSLKYLYENIITSPRIDLVAHFLSDNKNVKAGIITFVSLASGFLVYKGVNHFFPDINKFFTDNAKYNLTSKVENFNSKYFNRNISKIRDFMSDTNNAMLYANKKILRSSIIKEIGHNHSITISYNNKQFIIANKNKIIDAINNLYSKPDQFEHPIIICPIVSDNQTINYNKPSNFIRLPNGHTIGVWTKNTKNGLVYNNSIEYDSKKQIVSKSSKIMDDLPYNVAFNDFLDNMENIINNPKNKKFTNINFNPETHRIIKNNKNFIVINKQTDKIDNPLDFAEGNIIGDKIIYTIYNNGRKEEDVEVGIKETKPSISEIQTSKSLDNSPLTYS